MKQAEECLAPTHATQEKRHREDAVPALILVELNPADIVDGVRLDYGYVSEGISACGVTRETCPACEGAHLQLVLRQKNVRLAHLFCSSCTRCFDARLANGSSALSLA